jgi:hypothetical protein
VMDHGNRRPTKLFLRFQETLPRAPREAMMRAQS